MHTREAPRWIAIGSLQPGKLADFAVLDRNPLHVERRVLVPGGRLLLLDHIGSSWPPVYAAQWLVERFTIRTVGEHFTRRQLPLVEAAGFHIVETERLKAGTVERIHAVKAV